MSIGSGSAQDGQELCCTSCWGYHGNFPDCERVNASPAPAAIALGPAWRLFVWVMRPSLIVRGSLKMEEQKADSAAVQPRSQMDRTQNHTRRGARDEPKRAYAALNARYRTVCGAVFLQRHWINIQIGSKLLRRGVNSSTSRPPRRKKKKKTHRKIIDKIRVNNCKFLISHLQARCADLNRVQ